MLLARIVLITECLSKELQLGGVLTSQSAQLSQQELQDHTYRSLGRFFIAFARVELNLALLVGGAASFQDKLERFLETAIVQDGNNDQFYEISAWYMLADWMRETRNHGRTLALGLPHAYAKSSACLPLSAGSSNERRYSLTLA